MDENMEDVDNSRESLSSGRSSDSSSDNDETLGDPEIHPRVGDDYQVEVPELMMENDVLQYIKKLNDSPNCSSVGLPVAIMWVDGEGETIDSEALKFQGNRDSATYVNGSMETESSEDSQITSNDEDTQLKVEPLGTDSKYSKEARRRLSKLQAGVDGGSTDGDFSSSLKKGTSLEHGKRRGHFLPGSATVTLKDIEYDSFLLGLYIFGKNLNLVNKFVGSRKMGDILSNYYEKFYRSAEYVRWSQSRKIKSRRCVQGQRMFTGWRLNELLSRILPHMSEESKSSLIEVSKRFVEGKVRLEDYVFTLKDMVGLGVLVEAVAIGKGKRDLTGTGIDPSKTRQVLPVRPEIPSGKAWSSLTKGEIVKYLTGDFRLSKAKAADLFWEAVWPRLLARGWHSEQPRDHIHTALNNSLVFLVPGVSKFSRRKLTRGDHYFDSFTDVLNKVAAEPVHLELESDSEKVLEDKEECGSEPDVLLKKQRRSYLQPVKSKCPKDTFSFTIVDTSYFCAGKRGIIRELRNLPVDTVNMSTQSSLSSEPQRDNTKENQNETEVNNTSNHIENVVDRRALTDSAECVISNAPDHMPDNPDARNASLRNQENQRTNIPSDSHSSKMVKFQFSRKRKSQKSSNVEPIKEVIVGKHDASKYNSQAISEDTKLNGTDSCPLSSSSDRFEVKNFPSGAFQDISSVRPLVCNPEDSGKEAALNTCVEKEPSPKNTQSETLIDLNLPHVLPVSGTDGSVHTNNNSSTTRPSLLSRTSDQPELLNNCNIGTETEQQPVITGRRQSTRNRPLTTKALEAFAFEFNNPKKKRKGVDTMY